MNIFSLLGSPKKSKSDAPSGNNSSLPPGEFKAAMDLINTTGDVTIVSTTSATISDSAVSCASPTTSASANTAALSPTASASSENKNDGTDITSDNQTAVPTAPVSHDRGHVFILLADITKLACDAWVGASGGIIDPRWVPWFPQRPTVLRKRLNGKKTRITGYAGWPDGVPQGYSAALEGQGRGDAEFYTAVLEEYIEVAIQDLQGVQPLYGRKTHLIAMPLIGSGHGGGRSKTGELVRGLMPALMTKSIEHGVDFAIVTIEPDIWAAAQAERVRYMGGIQQVAQGILRDELIEDAIRLSHYALSGQLALFLGAGVCVGAGLPLWDRLLKVLAEEADIGADEQADFDKMTLYDQARIIQRRLAKKGVNLGELVAQKLQGTRYSPAHALLASLPVNEIITTNYDKLFETAAKLGDSPLSVLPHHPNPSAHRWLLKMHGCVGHPADIVLTRRDYIRYAERGAALGGIVQSTLLTKHLMFVGFSLSDDNFHRVFDAVLKTAPPEARHDMRSTALMLVRSQLEAELWEGEVGLTYIQEPSQNSADADIADLARKHDIMLDILAASCAVQARADFLLNDRFEMMLTDVEVELKKAVLQLKATLATFSREARDTPAYKVLQAALLKLGDRRSDYDRIPASASGKVTKILGNP